MTPEGKVKKAIDGYLDTINCCYKKPVPCGFGKSGVDYDVTYKGFSIAIEAKKKGVKKATPREEAYLQQVRDAGGIAFVADCVEDVSQTIIMIDFYVDIIKTQVYNYVAVGDIVNAGPGR